MNTPILRRFPFFCQLSGQDFTANVRVLTIEGVEWWVAMDVAKALDFADSSKMLKHVEPEDKMEFNPQMWANSELSQSFGVNTFRVCLINSLGVKKIITRTNKPNAQYLAKEFGLEVVTLTRQQEYIHILELAFSDLLPVKEFKVHGYKIDLYLSKVNIAVECDENGHYHYSEDAELKREAIIKAALGCSFIRFNPDCKQFNIGNVVKKIRDLIPYS